MVGDNHPDGRVGPQLRPWEIKRLTLAEVCWLLEEPQKDRGMSDADIVAYAEWLAKLTPLERLAAAQRGELL